MFDLHRHDEFSSFDGFGNAVEVARYAKELGHEAVCTTNHGNTSGLVQTYRAAKEVGIKPILGCEGYFLPRWKEKTRGYHLTIIAKDKVGYGNLNRLQWAGEQHKYYNPIWTFKDLEEYHDGLICTSACVAGYLAKAIASDKQGHARRFVERMQSIFGADFYIEIQPYRVSEAGLQEKVNRGAVAVAEEFGVKCILTSDSHRVRPEDFDTYVKMHQITGHDIEWVEGTYKDRYMPKPWEMSKRFAEMHGEDYPDAKRHAKEYEHNLSEIADKCDGDYLDELEQVLPRLGGSEDTYKTLSANVRAGLKHLGITSKVYRERALEELRVIKKLGFSDYFLMVADYTMWAKKNGIVVGPGRGSVCNCLVAYALGITEVNPVFFNLDFRRFLREDKTALPDVDLDFMPSRRQEVVDYICNKYEGKAARIVSYGRYKVDNLINDLAKVCEVGTTLVDDKGKERFEPDKKEISAIKRLCKRYVDDDTEELDAVNLLADKESIWYNRTYDNIILHFTKMYKKVRFMGTHAAGVAVTGGEILDYSALHTDKDGAVCLSYDMVDIDSINLVKFDILGLKTMESISDLRKSTGVTVNYYEIVNDPKIIEAFRNGDTDGVFQFDSKSSRQVLTQINAESFADVAAASAMNRPGPLSLGMPDIYANNKINVDDAKEQPWFKYTESTHGTIVYQEQVMQICINLGGLTWAEADKVIKAQKSVKARNRAMESEEFQELRKRFIDNASEHMGRDVAKNLFDDVLNYTFNQGHATGYTLISFEEMYYKVYFPVHYWFAKLKYAVNDQQYRQFCECAVADGCVVFPPHINYSTEHARLRKFEGEYVIQQGLSEIKNVGDKAATFIATERRKRPFTNFDDFYDRCKDRTVTSRVIESLDNDGALDFNKKRYLNRTVKYNAGLLAAHG